MKYNQPYSTPTSEVIDLRVDGDFMQDESVTFSNPNKVTESGGELNADEGFFDGEDSFAHSTSLWDE